MLDRARDLLQFVRNIKQVHLVVLISHLIGDAARPRLDLVELELLLVVPRLAHVHSLIQRQASGPALVVSRDEHDEAAVDHLFDAVVSVLTRLDHLVLEEMLVVPMDRLLRAIVPAGVDPFLP